MYTITFVIIILNYTHLILIVVNQKSLYFLYKAAVLLCSRNTVSVKAQFELAMAVKLQHRLCAVYACGVKQHEPHQGLAFYNGARLEAKKTQT